MYYFIKEIVLDGMWDTVLFHSSYLRSSIISEYKLFESIIPWEDVEVVCVILKYITFEIILYYLTLYPIDLLTDLSRVLDLSNLESMHYFIKKLYDVMFLDHLLFERTNVLWLYIISSKKLCWKECGYCIISQ